MSTELPLNTAVSYLTSAYSLLEVGISTNYLECFKGFAQYLSVSIPTPNHPAI